MSSPQQKTLRPIPPRTQIMLSSPSWILNILARIMILFSTSLVSIDRTITMLRPSIEEYTGMGTAAGGLGLNVNPNG